MHYTTVTVGIEQGDEAQAQAIDDAIAQGCTALSKEVGGPVELVNIVPVDTPNLLCLVIMVKPYQPPAQFVGVNPDAARRLMRKV